MVNIYYAAHTLNLENGLAQVVMLVLINNWSLRLSVNGGLITLGTDKQQVKEEGTIKKTKKNHLQS